MCFISELFRFVRFLIYLNYFLDLLHDLIEIILFFYCIYIHGICTNTYFSHLHQHIKIYIIYKIVDVTITLIIPVLY